MADPRFIHLRTHTEYSLLEGALRLKKLPGMCADMGMPAVAVTDTNNLFAALEFSVGAAGAGVQPIIGCQIDLRYFEHAPGERIRPPAPVVLLAQTERGYEHLMKLNSCLYLRRDNELAHVTLDELEAHSEDVICLSGGPDGPVGRLLRTNSRAAVDPYDSFYGNAYAGGSSFVKLYDVWTSGAKYIEAMGGSAGTYRNGTLQDGPVVSAVNYIASGKNAYVAGSGVKTYGANLYGAGSVTITRIGDLPSSTPAVPIPPAGALLAGGLVSMAAMRKRKAKAVKA